MTNSSYQVLNNIYYLCSSSTDETRDYWICGVTPEFNLAHLKFEELFPGESNNIHIAENAFKNCGAVEKIIFDSRVKFVATGAFENCIKLETIDFNTTTQPTLGKGCFKGCSALTTINNLYFDTKNDNTYLGYIFGESAAGSAQSIPQALSKITMQTPLLPRCFANCLFITEVCCSDDTTQIPFESFMNCINLEKIYKVTSALTLVPNPNTSIWKAYDEDSFETDYKNLATTDLAATDKLFTGGRAKGLVDLEGFSYIGDNAFRGCNRLDTVFIPQAVIKFGTDCFRDCFGLVRVYNGTTNTPDARYIVRGSTDYGCIGLYALQIIERALDTVLTKPEELGSILKVGTNTYLINPLDSMIQNDKVLNLSAVKKYAEAYEREEDFLWEDITHIRAGFAQNLNIKVVRLPETLKEIGDFAFKNSPLVQLDNLSTELSVIGKYAFDGCANFNTIRTIDSGDWHWSSIEFGWPQRIYDNITAIKQYTVVNSSFDEPSILKHTVSLKVLTLEENPTTTWTVYPKEDANNYVKPINLIANGHFFDTLVIDVSEGSPTEILPNTCYNCTTLKYIKTTDGSSTPAVGVPATVESIGKNAFYNCDINYVIKEEPSAAEPNACGVKRLGDWIFGPEKDDLDHNDYFFGYKTCYIDVSDGPVHFYTDAFKNCSTLENIVLVGSSERTCLTNWFNSTFNNIYANPFYTEVSGQHRKLFINDCTTEITNIDLTGYDVHNLTDFVGSGLVLDSFTFKNAPAINADGTRVLTHKQIAKNAFIGASIKSVTCLPSMLKLLATSSLQHVSVVPYSDFSDTKHIYQDLDIEHSAVKNCTNLTTVIFDTPIIQGEYIPNTTVGIQKIGADAFYGCTNITSVTFEGIFSEREENKATIARASWSIIDFENAYANPMCYSRVSLGYNRYSLKTELRMTQKSSHAKFFNEGVAAESEVISNLSSIYFNARLLKPFVFLNLVNLSNLFVQDVLLNISPKAFAGCHILNNIVAARSNLDMPYWLIRKFKPLTSGTSSSVAGSYIIRKSDGVLIYGTRGDYIIDNKGSSAVNGGTVTDGPILGDNIPTAIAPNAYYYCTNLSSITIPNTVTSIGLGAFEGCTNLKSLSIPFLGKSAVYDEHYGHFSYIFGANQPSNTEAYIENGSIPQNLSVTLTGTQVNIVPAAFEGCEKIIETLYINGNISKASGDPLQYLASTVYKNIGIESGTIKSITNSAFEPKILVKVMSVTNNEFTIPSTVQYIYNYSFSECATITSIIGLTPVPILGDYAFYKCTKLAGEIILAAKYIGNYVFQSCKSINAVILTNTLSVGTRIFQDCVSLRTLYIPLTLLPENTRAEAFAGSSDGDPTTTDGLHHVEMPIALSSYFGDDGKLKLRSVTLLVTRPDDIIKSAAFAHCAWLRKVVIKQSSDNGALTSIGSQAFLNCLSLNQFIFEPKDINHVVAIGSQAFKNCYNLYEIDLPSELATSAKAIREYTYYKKQPIKTLLETKGSSFIVSDDDLESLVPYKLTVANSQTLRFLSNTFCVVIYECLESAQGNKYLRQVGYETFDFKSGKDYYLSFLPYASFTQAEVGNCNSTVTRHIDLILQKKLASQDNWLELLNTETGYLTTNPEFTCKKLISLNDLENKFELNDLVFTAPYYDAGEWKDPNNTGFKLNDKYDPTVSSSQPYLYENGRYKVTVNGYLLDTNLGKDAFTSCYKLRNITLNLSSEDYANAGFSAEAREEVEFIVSGDFCYFEFQEGLIDNLSTKYELVGYLKAEDLDKNDKNESIIIPSDINIIGAHTFANRDNLTASMLSFPANLEQINNQAFYSCDSLHKGQVLNKLNDSVIVATNAFDRCLE